MIVCGERLGTQTVALPRPVAIISSAAIAGDMEGQGRYGKYFDLILEDDLWGQDSFEKCESKLFEETVRMAVKKSGHVINDVDLLLGGDLLNQIISANYAARQLQTPFMGLYGACSTSSQSLLLGAMLVAAGYSALCACATSSHFATAERQFRFPLELGNQKPPSAQRTITGSGCSLLAPDTGSGTRVVVTGGTIGRVIDLGITDGNNMGAAMAPAAADTLAAHFEDVKGFPSDYDIIVTGDLGKYGRKLTDELLLERGYDISDKHFDCGEQIFRREQDTHAGGSGCGCAAIMFCGYIMDQMLAGNIKNALFMATGALMNPGISLQGESIPGVAHAVTLQRRT